MMTLSSNPRSVCFVTGTRAEFGLMERTLDAIRTHPGLRLQLLVTGMHLSAKHGKSIDSIRAGGWTIDATVPWPTKPLAVATGRASAAIAEQLDRLKSDLVLVVGDRVEAFAAASAAHLSGRVVAHVHGGDRALGQVDDCLRHAITKLSHVHFPATVESEQRLLKLGEDRWRVHRVGSPGIDGMVQAAAPFEQLAKMFPAVKPRQFVLLVLHPTVADDEAEFEKAKIVRAAVGPLPCVVIFPNNDPGHAGIVRCWQSLGGDDVVCKNVDRPVYLGLLRDAAMLVGNSSSGMIEAASFGTPVIDIGDRQAGRERGVNVTHVPVRKSAIAAAVGKIWNHGRPGRTSRANVYGRGDTAGRIVQVLATLKCDDRLRRKLIAY